MYQLVNEKELSPHQASVEANSHQVNGDRRKTLTKNTYELPGLSLLLGMELIIYSWVVRSN